MISKATVDDAIAITALLNAGYRGPESKLGWTTEDDLIGGIRMDVAYLIKLINRDDCELLKYTDDEGIIIACVYLEYTEKHTYLGMLCVRPRLQGKGVGKELLLEGERRAKAKGIFKMKMTVVSVRHELIAFYERKGYVLTGETQPFEGEGIFGDMKQPLQFAVLVKDLIAS